jgi:hypothetical protein
MLCRASRPSSSPGRNFKFGPGEVFFGTLTKSKRCRRSTRQRPVRFSDLLKRFASVLTLWPAACLICRSRVVVAAAEQLAVPAWTAEAAVVVTRVRVPLFSSKSRRVGHRGRRSLSATDLPVTKGGWGLAVATSNPYTRKDYAQLTKGP